MGWKKYTNVYWTSYFGIWSYLDGSIDTYLIGIISKYYKYITTITTQESRFLFTNIDIGGGAKIEVSTVWRRISRLSFFWLVSMTINCIIGFNIVTMAMNRSHYKNLYHFGGLARSSGRVMIDPC